MTPAYRSKECGGGRRKVVVHMGERLGWHVGEYWRRHHDDGQCHYDQYGHKPQHDFPRLQVHNNPKEGDRDIKSCQNIKWAYPNQMKSDSSSFASNALTTRAEGLDYAASVCGYSDPFGSFARGGYSLAL